MGHFYLCKLLTETLIKTAFESGNISRIISVSSGAQMAAPNPIKSWLIDDTNIQNKTEYGPILNYAFSKACNILFAKEYNDRYYNKNVYAVSLHPGEIYTELDRYMVCINPTITALLKSILFLLGYGLL